MNEASYRSAKEQAVATTECIDQSDQSDRLPTTQELTEARVQQHQLCFACGDHHPFGLKLKFQPDGEGGVSATFDCRKNYEGFGDRLHGGIVATLLDSAMVSWLMGAGIKAYTADLQVRFHLPVEIGIEAEIRAVRACGHGPIHRMEAQLVQNGQLRASARARFLETKSPADA